MSKNLLIVPVIFLILSFILPFTYWPEMLNWPYWMAQGLLPYRDIAIVHTPFLLFLLTPLYLFFGNNHLVLHLFGSSIFFVTLLLIGLLTRSKLSQFIFLLLGLTFNGNTVWFESLLAPILLCIFYFQIANRYFLVGLFLGLAIITKQTAAFIFPAVFIGFLQSKPKTPNFVKIFIGFLVPIIFLGLYLVKNNLSLDFYRWAIQFVFLKPFEVMGENSYVLYPNLNQIMIVAFLFVLGLLAVIKNRSRRNYTLFIWMLCSYFFATPRFEFFHLIPMAVFWSVILSKSRIIFVALPLCLLLFCYFTFKSFRTDHVFVNPNNINTARTIKEITGNKYFLLNGQDQLYFLTGSLPGVRPYLPQLPWYLVYYGDQFLVDFVSQRPPFVVFSPYLQKAINGLGAYEPPNVLDYLYSNYFPVSYLEGGTTIFKLK